MIKRKGGDPLHNRDIYDFACKWKCRFEHPDEHLIEDFWHQFGSECEEVGLIRIPSKYTADQLDKAYASYLDLEKVITQIKDMETLGFMLYDRWNMLVQTGRREAVLKLEHRAWFILVLSQLMDVVENALSLFRGELKEMRLTSDVMLFGRLADRFEEVEQFVKISANGKIAFSGYNWVHQLLRSRMDRTDPSLAGEILDLFESYFGHDYERIVKTDTGIWMLELENTEGKIYTYRGCLEGELIVDGKDLSQAVREAVKRHDLFMFDGNPGEDAITKIVIDYHHLTKRAEDLFDFSEEMIIDHDQGLIELIQKTNGETIVATQYHLKNNWVEYLFSYFQADSLFRHVEENPEDVIETPDDIRTYQITLDYRKRPQRRIEGSFDYLGLPYDFSDFADTLEDFLSREIGFGDILNPKVYLHRRRTRSDYIYCSVRFHSAYQSYYYLTDDESIRAGDNVLVPVGLTNVEKMAQVVKVEYYSKDKVPFPVEDTKWIIRKCRDADIEKIT